MTTRTESRLDARATSAATPPASGAKMPVAINEPGSGSVREGLREVWEHRNVVGEIVRRDLKLRYKNSLGGVAWSLFNPLMQIFVLTMLLKFILPHPVKNGSAYLFVLFLWNFIVNTLGDACTSLIGNAPLVRKTYFPRAILPLAALISNAFHFAIAFAFTLIYFFALRTYPEQLRWEFLLIVPVFFFCALGCLGLSLIFAYLNVFYEDVRFVVAAMLQLVFYSLPVLYTVEQVKAKGLLNVWLLNPAAAMLTTYQRALLGPPVVLGPDGKTPLSTVGVPWLHFGLACGFCTLMFLLGLKLFERYKWEAVERL